MYTRIFREKACPRSWYIFFRRVVTRLPLYTYLIYDLIPGPIIIDNLLQYANIDFVCALRIAAFISIPLLIVGNIFIKKCLPPREPGPLSDVKFLRIPDIVSLSQLSSSSSGVIGRRTFSSHPLLRKWGFQTTLHFILLPSSIAFLLGESFQASLQIEWGRLTLSPLRQ